MNYPKKLKVIDHKIWLNIFHQFLCQPITAFLKLQKFSKNRSTLSQVNYFVKIQHTNSNPITGYAT